jgi:hypothetical protein
MQFGQFDKQHNFPQCGRLTVNNHFPGLRSLVIKGGHSALVLARQFRCRIDDLQCPVHCSVVV